MYPPSLQYVISKHKHGHLIKWRQKPQNDKRGNMMFIRCPLASFLVMDCDMWRPLISWQCECYVLAERPAAVHVQRHDNEKVELVKSKDLCLSCWYESPRNLKELFTEFRAKIAANNYLLFNMVEYWHPEQRMKSCSLRVCYLLFCCCWLQPSFQHIQIQTCQLPLLCQWT